MSQNTQGRELSCTQFFYAQDRLVTQVEGQSTRTVLRARGLLLAQLRCDDNALQTVVLTMDAKDSVLMASVSGEAQSFAYPPYGSKQESADLPGLPGFNGETRDAVTGHYFLGLGYRLYNPVLMRFQSTDSLSPFGEGGLNGYAYVSGDPVNFSDPTGHMPTKGVLPAHMKRPHSLIVSPNSQKTRASRKPAMNRSISTASSSSLLSTPSPLSGGSPPLGERYSSPSSVFSNAFSEENQGWKLNKAAVRKNLKLLTKVEQQKFDEFQNSIHNKGLPPWEAVLPLGDVDYKLYRKDLGIYQFRLNGGTRVHFEVEGKTVIIRQVGGHA